MVESSFSIWNISIYIVKSESVISRPTSNMYHLFAIKDRATNEFSFKRSLQAAKVPRPNVAPTTTTEMRHMTWGDHLAGSGIVVTYYPWIKITNISPNSSLDSMMDAVQQALDEELLKGIVDLDAPFVPHQTAPMLRETPEAIAAREEPHPHILEARLIISPFARPTGWYVRLAHRSMAQALRIRAKNGPGLKVSHRKVEVKQHRPNPKNPVFPGTYPTISDATIRVENCPSNLTKITFINFFSRYDLSMDHDQSIVHWTGVTPDGREASTDTFLVHFSDPSWARAAVRERQGSSMSGHPVRLIQYPRQLL